MESRGFRECWEDLDSWSWGWEREVSVDILILERLIKVYEFRDEIYLLDKYQSY